MEHVDNEPENHRDHDAHIEIRVNEHEVIVHEHRMTGLEIKQAAIAQNVPIQLDFVLSMDRPHERPKIIGDDEPVTVNKNSKFHAVAPDDNS